jgi:glycosyltransferase involved in cell wall biosynthesis
MKILIDFTQIPVQKVGVGVYALNLITKIAKIDRRNIYYVLVQNDDRSLDFINQDNFILIRVKSALFRHLLSRFLLEQFYIPYLIKRADIDVSHSLHYSFPLVTFRAKKIVNIYDMTFFLFPHLHVFIKVRYFRFYIKLASKLAHKIITISHSTRRDLIREFKISPDRLRVIYPGKSELFNPDLDRSRISSAKKAYGIKTEYFLFIGTIEPRKNIRNLILAYHQFLRENDRFALVIAGKMGWHQDGITKIIDKLGLSRHVILAGYVKEEDKPFLISGSSIFIYPSIYEGFGIPVLEALACGIPTITSNVSSLPEVAGEAAVLIDPSSVDELYAGMKRLTADEKYYNELKERSISQAAKFDWAMAAKDTIRVYESVYSQPSQRPGRT